jgi:hypothetical protein
MKKYIAVYAIVAAALVAAPAIVRAEDNPHKPSAAESHKAAKKHGLPFHGKVTAVDATAMTVTVGKMTINVTSETKISKEGKPAAFSDITVGEKISGAYQKDDAGKMTASVIHIGGGKAEGKKKKAEKE